MAFDFDFGSLFSDPLAVAATGFSGLGAFSQLMGAIRAMDQSRQQDRLQSQMAALGRTPVQTPPPFVAPPPVTLSPADPQQFFRPMSDAEQAARMRAIKADLVTRGVPLDSGYATNLIAEEMARTESGRFDRATQYALNQRGQDLNAALGNRSNDISAGLTQRNQDLSAALGSRGLTMDAFGRSAPSGQIAYGGGDISPMFAYLGKLQAARRGERGTNTVPTGSAFGNPDSTDPQYETYGLYEPMFQQNPYRIFDTLEPRVG